MRGAVGGGGVRRAASGAVRGGVRTGVVGSGRRRRGRGRRRAVRGVRAPVQQRVQPAPARAAHPRGAAGGVRHVRALLQDAAVSPPPHAGAAPARAPAPQAAAAARAAARPALPTVAPDHHPTTRERNEPPRGRHRASYPNQLVLFIATSSEISLLSIQTYAHGVASPRAARS